MVQARREFGGPCPSGTLLPSSIFWESPVVIARFAGEVWSISFVFWPLDYEAGRSRYVIEARSRTGSLRQGTARIASGRPDLREAQKPSCATARICCSSETGSPHGAFRCDAIGVVGGTLVRRHWSRPPPSPHLECLRYYGVVHFHVTTNLEPSCVTAGFAGAFRICAWSVVLLVFALSHCGIRARRRVLFQFRDRLSHHKTSRCHAIGVAPRETTLEETSCCSRHCVCFAQSVVHSADLELVYP